jgi:pilus assembly protein Flp/PilA
MRKLLRAMWKDEDGLTSVEYALLLVLVVIVAITAWTTLGGNVNSKVTNVAGKIGT